MIADNKPAITWRCTYNMEDGQVLRFTTRPLLLKSVS